MTTAANVRRSESSRFYWPNGTECFEVPKKSGNGMKKPTITEARELGLLCSVTTVIRTMDKPDLNRWLREQACLAVLTTPRNPGESLDSFVNRVLNEEKVQEQEGKSAADLGSSIHDAISDCLQGREFDQKYKPYVESVLPVIAKLGKIVWVEKRLVGDGYAGRGDILLETDRTLALLDWKSTKKIPKESYKEHRMQTAAYAKTLGNVADRHIITGNVYISTVMPGEVSLSLQENWQDAYDHGFKPLLDLWCYLNEYDPREKV